MSTRAGTAIGCVLAAALAAGCSGSAPVATPTPTPTPTMSAPPTLTLTPTPTPTADTASPPGPTSVDGTLLTAAHGLGSVRPSWLYQRPLPKRADGFGEVRRTPRVLTRRAFTLPDSVQPLPGDGYQSRIVSPAPRHVIERSTWHAGCPVAATDLAWLRVAFWGFDAQRHFGEVLVNQIAANDLDAVFQSLFDSRFPMEGISIARAADLTAAPTGDGNGTGVFACRNTKGQNFWSQHAYGLAIDVNSFQNPYQRGDLVLPELASSYLDRGDVRPGMITADGPVVRAFARIGWTWGGTWRTLKDYQHFSANGL